MASRVVHIQMLGPFEVTFDGVRIEASDFGSRKARELLKWLADARNEVVRDDVLVHAVWPELSIDRALRSLRVRISELRRTLQLGKNRHLERVDSGYVLRTSPSGVQIDVDQFIDLATRALQKPILDQALPLLKESLALYKGDYLADDPGTIHWKSTREHCRSLFLNVCSALADLYEQNQQYQHGIQLMQTLLQRPDRDEGHYRRLMRLQYLNGDQAAALRTYQHCREYLDKELGARPMPETVWIFERVLRHEPLTMGPAGGVPFTIQPQSIKRLNGRPEVPFLGRRAELSRIVSHIRQVETGQGGIVWIHGPSGIGKTRLLEEAIRARDGSGTGRVLWIRGSYLNARIPYTSIVEGLQTGLRPQLNAKAKRALLDPSLGTLHALLGWETATGPDERAFHDKRPSHSENLWLRQELLELFRRLAREAPLICCVDDVHALDSASQSFVLALANRVHEHPLLLLASSRREPRESNLGGELVAAHGATQVLELRPLSLAALAPLVGRGIPSLWSEQWLRQLHEDSRGEPFALIERLHALKKHGMIEFQHGGLLFKSSLLALMTNREHRSTAESYICRGDDLAERLSSLGESEQTLLFKAAILDGSLTLERLRKLANMSRGSFDQTVERLVRARFLQFGTESTAPSPQLSFPHSQLQRFIYHQVPRSERIWYHHMVFNMLKDEITSEAGALSGMKRVGLLSEGALHALLTGDWAEATKWSLRAAAAAGSITPGLEVVALCRQAFRAAQRLEPNHPLKDKAKRAFADALFSVGAFQEALPLYEALIKTEPSAGTSGGVTTRLISTYLHLNKSGEALALSQHYLEQARHHDTSRGKALLLRARVHYRAGDVGNAIRRGEEAIALFGKLGQTEKSAATHEQLALVFWDLGQYGRAVQSSQKSLEQYRSVDSPHVMNVLNQLGELYQDLFCVDRAIALHREALQLALKHRDIVMSIEVWRNLGLNYIFEGRIKKGMNTLYQAWEQVNDLDLGAYSREVHLRSLIEAHILCNQSAKARELLHLYQSVIGPRERPFVYIFKAAIAILDERIEEGEMILNEVFNFWDQTGRRGRAFHVLNFVGQALMRHGHTGKAETYIQLTLDEMQRIQASLPPDLAREMGQSRQFLAIKKLTGIFSA